MVTQKSHVLRKTKNYPPLPSQGKISNEESREGEGGGRGAAGLRVGAAAEAYDGTNFAGFLIAVAFFHPGPYLFTVAFRQLL